jgi:predicted nucleic acid-binding protein
LKRLLLDTNVVLDFVLGRSPFAAPAALLWSQAVAGHTEVVIPAHGVTTIHYLAARSRGGAFARSVVANLLVVPSIAPIDAVVLRRALALEASDFEDAVCAAAAEAARCDLIVTRDPKGYRHSPVAAVDPTTALSLVRDGSEPGEVHEPAPARRRPAAPGRARAQRR